MEISEKELNIIIDAMNDRIDRLLEMNPHYPIFHPEYWMEMTTLYDKLRYIRETYKLYNERRCEP